MILYCLGQLFKRKEYRNEYMHNVNKSIDKPILKKYLLFNKVIG